MAEEKLRWQSQEARDRSVRRELQNPSAHEDKDHEGHGDT